MKSNVKLFQICHNEEIYSNLLDGVENLDWRHNPHPQLREIAVFDFLFRKGLHKQFDLLGALSPKFPIKTGISFSQFHKWVSDNSGYDLYFINPYPQYIYHSFNVWERGRALYGNSFFTGAVKLLEIANYPYDIRDTGRTDHRSTSYCNFWVGNTVFWDRFLPDMQRLMSLTKNDMPIELFEEFFTPQKRRPGLIPTGRISSVFHRLVSTFIKFNPDLKILAYPVNRDFIQERCITPFEKLVVSEYANRIDEWDSEEAYSEERVRYFEAMSQSCVAYERAHLEFNRYPFPDKI